MFKKRTEIHDLEWLYEQYKNQIYTLCVRLTNNRSQADDLFSETWTKVAEKYRNIKYDKNPMAWIYTICINNYRKTFAKQRVSILQEDFLPHNNYPGFFGASIEESLIEQETTKTLHKTLSKLDDKYRLPILLFYFKDFSYNDIAKIMKIPMSTVKFRLNYAKELLKKEMESY